MNLLRILATVSSLTMVSRVLGYVRDFFIARVFAAEPEKFAVTVQLLRITFPYIAFISLVALSAGILNTWNRFAVPAITPALLNVAFIVGAAFFAEHFDPPILVLAWAVFAGGILQLAFQIPFLIKMKLLPRWRLDLSHPGVRRVLLLMAPAAFGVSVSQISLVLNQIFASFLPTGSVSWLYYADRLMELPAGVLGVAVGTILLPSLSKVHARSDIAEYSRLLDWGLRVTVLLAVPAAAALAVLALPLITMLFQYGRFGVEDAWMTRQALVAYSVGLIGMILVKILAPGFYARQNVATPVKIGLVTLVATQLMNLAFVGPLRHAGLALAIGLGACLNALLLYVILRKHQIYTPQPGWPVFILKVLASVAFMAVVLFTTMGEAAWWLQAGWQKVPAVLGLVALGTAAYAGCLLAFGLRPRDFSRRAAE
jgi:putative peptidoglycan lipid II flippase